MTTQQFTFTLTPAGDIDGVDVFRLKSADFDGDGDLDILAALNRGGNMALFVNDGQGVYQRIDTGIPFRRYENTFIGDFDADGDGDIDLAVGGAALGINPAHEGYLNALYLNDGNATFFQVDAGEFDDYHDHHWAMATMDLEGDGDLDLVVTAGRRNRLYHNDGNAHFTRMDAGSLWGPFEWIGELPAFDADGDGDMDVATGSGLFSYENLADSGRVTSPLIAPSLVLPGSGELRAWYTLSVEESLAGETTITYSVLDPSTGSPVPGFSDLRPDDTGRIELGGLDPVAYPAIYLQATLSDLHGGPDYQDRSPQLCRWQVSFDVGSEPAPTPTASASPVPTNTPTATSTATPTPTSTATPTSTTTPTPTGPLAPLLRYLPLILYE